MCDAWCVGQIQDSCGNYHGGSIADNMSVFHWQLMSNMSVCEDVMVVWDFDYDCSSYWTSGHGKYGGGDHCFNESPESKSSYNISKYIIHDHLH